eukprot:Sspe_Gene.54809::Locus_30199_Transcript_1_3_Confidence_0.821_Length_1091::g.54809::m.54809
MARIRRSDATARGSGGSDGKGDEKGCASDGDWCDRMERAGTARKRTRRRMRDGGGDGGQGGEGSRPGAGTDRGGEGGGSTPRGKIFHGNGKKAPTPLRAGGFFDEVVDAVGRDGERGLGCEIDVEAGQTRTECDKATEMDAGQTRTKCDKTTEVDAGVRRRGSRCDTGTNTDDSARRVETSPCGEGQRGRECDKITEGDTELGCFTAGARVRMTTGGMRSDGCHYAENGRVAMAEACCWTRGADCEDAGKSRDRARDARNAVEAHERGVQKRNDGEAGGLELCGAAL